MGAILLFVVMLAMLMFGFPVSFTLGGVSLIAGYLTFGLDFFNMLPLRIWGTMTNQVLIAVPLFVYMGVMFEKSGLAEELLETMALFFGRMRGGVAISVIVVGMVLAASTGIVGATVVTMGLLSLPTMLKRNYPAPLATGVICAAGTLGQIIPPSVVLVLLGSIMNISIGDLFVGAVVPGLGLVAMYILYILILTFIQPDSCPAMPEEEIARFRSKGMAKRILRAFVLPFGLILAVLGSIFAGIASPTEAAAVGAAGATLLCFTQGKLNMGTLTHVMRGTTTLTCMVFILLVGASAFGLVFRGLGGDHYITQLILESNLSPGLFLFLVMALIFVAGFFIDFIEITFIIVPVVAPIFQKLGMDLLWIAILMAINLQTSFLTPPFGFSLFYLKGVAPPSVTTGHIYRGVVPFIILQCVMVALVVFFPEIATWLPRTVFSGK